MAVKTKKRTCLILPNGVVSEDFMKRLGFEIGCIDRHEIQFVHKKVLNAEEKKAIRDKISRKAILFYNESVKKLTVYVREELVKEDVWITSEQGKRYTPEQIKGGELLSSNDAEGQVTVRLKSGEVVVLDNIDLDYE
jgi:hypothetical protein